MSEPTQAGFAVEVEYRSAPAFLVAYSVQLSRGGLVLDSHQDLPPGAPVRLTLIVPEVEPIELVGAVAFRRGADGEGLPGIGVEIADVVALGGVVDQLVPTFRGVQVLVLSGDRHDRATLARSIKSIISTAEIMQAADQSIASALMTTEVDLAVLDVDVDAQAAIAMVRAAKALPSPVPAVALSVSPQLRDLAVQAGADEVATNPPPFAELQVVLVRAMSKPIRIAISPL